jgi:pyrroloquinoline quinone biosynthesis protein B
MGHLPVGGRGGSLHRLADVAPPKRFFIHINNTNPLVRDDSPERAAVRAAGWDVARDGQDLEL